MQRNWSRSLVSRPLSLSLILLLAATCTVASSGDRAEEYQSCVASCHTHSCINQPQKSLPLPLRLARWTCLDDCKYVCMHSVTDAAVNAGTRIHQYHGKWPFWRFAGMQEPASVAFSMLNLVSHVRGYTQVERRIPDGHPMKRYYLLFALVSINAWIWSSVFHTRDLPITEKLDYFSAALAIMFALFYSVVRFFHLYPQRLQTFRSQVTARSHSAWAILCALAFVGHVSYLTLLPRFDYTYNIVFNLAVGMTHNLLWLSYSLPSSLCLFHRFPSRPKAYRPNFAYKAALFVLTTTATTALELFDFPPLWRIFDAHALWHLSTAPIILFWYQFLIEDALDDGWRAPKQE